MADPDLRCQDCGARPDYGDTPAGNGPAWAWSMSTDDRQPDARQPRRTVLCPQCARANARSIEARLDEDWW